jgi:hypothetical protein
MGALAYSGALWILAFLALAFLFMLPTLVGLIRRVDRLGHADPRAIQPRPLSPEQVQRIVVSMRPARPRQRERVHQRTSPGLHMKGVEGTQNRLTMRHCRWRIPTPRRPLPSHRVHHPRRCPRRRPCHHLPRPGNSTRLQTRRRTPVRTGRLHAHLDPAAKVPRLNPGRLPPPHLNRPQETKPPQQIHPIRTLRRRRPPASLQITQEHRDRNHHHAVAIQQPVRLPHIPRRHHRPRQPDDQRPEIPRHPTRFGHEPQT